jgi:hypothetical protein
MAVSVPMITDMTKLEDATINVFPKDSKSGLLFNISEYHLIVNPSKIILRREVLKENKITIAMGAYKKANTKPEKMRDDNFCKNKFLCLFTLCRP